MTRASQLAAVAVVVAALGGVAHAAPIAPPPGWIEDPQLAARGPGRDGATLTAYRAPVPGAVLYLTRVERAAAPAVRDAIATAELDELAAAMRRQGASASSTGGSQRAVARPAQLEADLAWRDAAAGLTDRSRIVVAASEHTVVAVTGQCVLAGQPAPALEAACTAALATLDPEIAATARVPLAISALPQPAEPTGARMMLGDGARDPLPPMPVAPPPRARAAEDRRPLYLGAGLVGLAALFYWNRRRRDRFADDADAPARGEDAPP